LNIVRRGTGAPRKARQWPDCNRRTGTRQDNGRHRFTYCAPLAQAQHHLYDRTGCGL